MVALPTADDLEKLPLRALVAYATRAALRLCSVLRGDPAEPTINNALSLATAVVRAEPITSVDVVCVVGASADVVDLLGTVRGRVEKYRAAFSAFDAGRTAWEVLIAASGLSISSAAATRAVGAANAAARAAELLDEPQATWAIEAAHRDYVALLKKFGEQTEVVIGEAFDLAEMDEVEELSEGSSGDERDS